LNENEKERLRRVLSVPPERPVFAVKKKITSKKPRKRFRFSRRSFIYLSLVMILGCVTLLVVLKVMNRSSNAPARTNSRVSTEEVGKHSFFKCLDMHSGDAEVCVKARLKTTTLGTVNAWLTEYAANHSGQDEKPKIADMEKLCSFPPGEEKPQREYVVDKRSIKNTAEDKHKVKLAMVTSKDVSVFTVIADCNARRLSYGCVKVYDAGVKNLISKSNECDSGYFGMFRNPVDDDLEVVTAFCQRYGAK
jgi:hypothetical protein